MQCLAWRFSSYVTMDQSLAPMSRFVCVYITKLSRQSDISIDVSNRRHHKATQKCATQLRFTCTGPAYSPL